MTLKLWSAGGTWGHLQLIYDLITYSSCVFTGLYMVLTQFIHISVQFRSVLDLVYFRVDLVPGLVILGIRGGQYGNEKQITISKTICFLES